MTAPEATTPAPGWVADDSRFGARLALIRQRMGWGNIDKAARECGIPVETWRSWERDNREPQRLVTIAMAIATKTGCDYLWLVHGPSRGGAIRTSAYPPATVLATVGTPRPPRQRRRAGIHMDPARPVRQTRPVGDGSIRPRTPIAV